MMIFVPNPEVYRPCGSRTINPMDHPLDRTTKILLALRVASVLIPQYGYIHADEFFQSTEISAADILRTDAYRPWEFTTSKPIRSAVFVHLFAYAPYHLLRIVGHTPYLRLVLPRLVACTLSFLIDAVAYRMKGPSAIKLTSSSYLALTFFTRTFSNLTETVLFSLLLLMSVPTTKMAFYTKRPVARPVVRLADEDTSAKANDDGNDDNGSNPDNSKKPVGDAGSGEEAEVQQQQQQQQSVKTMMDETVICRMKWVDPSSSTFLYASILAAGLFNRPTFICFALMPVVHRFWRTTFIAFVGSCVRLFMLALPVSVVFTLLDSIYYRGLAEFLLHPLDSVVVTPLNFLLYNSSPQNLANHGVHPRWLHMVVNIPILFGAHSLFFYCNIYRSLWGLPGIDFKFLLNCMLVPMAFLSVFPHQEPRFLLPLLLPFALLHSETLFESSRSRAVWYAFNATLFVFFGFLHQAAVVPSQMSAGMEGKVIYYQTYMPPRHLAPMPFHNREVVDLKEAPLDGLEAALRHHHEGYLVFPSGVEAVVDSALQNVVCSIEDHTTQWPHLATEFLSSAWRRCGFNFKCLAIDSMLLHRVRFHCEPVL